MWYIFNLYTMYIYMRNIYGIYITICFLKWLLGKMYKFFSYFIEPEIKMIQDKKI